MLRLSFEHFVKDDDEDNSRRGTGRGMGAGAAHYRLSGYALSKIQLLESRERESGGGRGKMGADCTSRKPQLTCAQLRDIFYLWWASKIAWKGEPICRKCFCLWSVQFGQKLISTQPRPENPVTEYYKYAPICGQLQHFHWVTQQNASRFELEEVEKNRLEKSNFLLISCSHDLQLPAPGHPGNSCERLQRPGHLCGAQLRHCRGSCSQIPWHLRSDTLLGLPRGPGEGRLYPMPGQLCLHGATAGLRRLGGVEVAWALYQINSVCVEIPA